jgi:signal transduction histidine kinase/CheY-like chemotaxis protein
MPLFREFLVCGLLILLFQGVVAHAELVTTEINQNIATRFDLAGASFVLEDPSWKLDLDAVKSSPNAEKFARSTPGRGFTPAAIWLRFSLINSTDRPVTWWLDTGNRTLQELDFYAPDAQGNYQGQSASSTLPFSRRPLHMANFVFPVELPAHQPVQLFLRVRSTGYQGVDLNPALVTPEAAQKAAASEKNQWFVYLGMTLTLGIINLGLGLYLRDRNYLLYVTTTFGWAWAVSSVSGGYGAAYETFWPDSPVFEQVSWVAATLVATFFVIYFVVTLVEYERVAPRTLRWMWIAVGGFGGAVCVQVALTLLQRNDLAHVLQITYLVGAVFWLFVPVMLWTGGVAVVMAGNRMIWYVMAANVPNTITVSFETAAATLAGRAPNFGAPFMWTSAFELFVMALALADLFYQEKAKLVAGLQRSEQNLEHKVDERTHALSEALQQQKVLALENARQFDEIQYKNQQLKLADQHKSDFLANMSHEIRTPMNAIIGLSHLVMNTELEPRQRDSILKIRQSGHHLLGIINDILDFSKIAAGKLTVEKVDFKLEHVLENVANLVAEKASKKGLELVFSIGADVPDDLLGDGMRLGQILINYASNAVKFTESGEIDILVQVKEKTDHDVLLYFAVRDTGIGLSIDQIQRLFRSFEQADASTTRKFGGTGLGLAICKQLAELMDGGVGVESALGEGSTFWFTARLGLGEYRPRALLPIPDLRGRRVLVVDDNENARTVLSDILTRMAFIVDTAESGMQAIELTRTADLAGHSYEIAFLDWQMPGMDGIETATAVQALALQVVPHLVMMTAYGQESVLQQATAVGFAQVLSKPINASMMFDTVMNLLGPAEVAHRFSDDAPTERPRKLDAIQGARVLLVEDNDLNQEVATGLLEHAGLVVDVAGNGEIALRMVQSGTYDIVFMDMQMPVMDGLDATREIRKLEQFSSLPIVAMTANAMQGDPQRCIDAGMNDFVAKPIDPGLLWAALLKWVQPRQFDAPLATSVRHVRQGVTELPAVIQGVDITLGLKRVVGDRSFYLAMLRKFASGQKSTMDAIRTALKDEDWGTAERLAHTTKSVAANIGAMPLAAVAAELEAGIKGRASLYTLHVKADEVGGLLTEVITQLELHLPGEQVSKKQVVDLEMLMSVSRNLADLLANYNSAAIDVINENGDLLREALKDAYSIIEDAVRNFEFDEALSALKVAMQAYEEHQ